MIAPSLGSMLAYVRESKHPPLNGIWLVHLIVDGTQYAAEPLEVNDNIGRLHTLLETY